MFLFFCCRDLPDYLTALLEVYVKGSTSGTLAMFEQRCQRKVVVSLNAGFRWSIERPKRQRSSGNSMVNLDQKCATLSRTVSHLNHLSEEFNGSVQAVCVLYGGIQEHI